MTSQVTSWETALCFSAHHTDKTHTPPRRKPRRPNKKGTNQKPKEKPRNTHKRNLDNKHAAGCTAVISCCLCLCAVMSLQLSLVCPNVSRPQVEFRHRRGDAISNELDRPPSWNENWLGGRLRASVSPMETFQLRKSAHSDMPRKERNLLKGVSVSAFVKKSAIFISVGM